MKADSSSVKRRDHSSPPVFRRPGLPLASVAGALLALACLWLLVLTPKGARAAPEDCVTGPHSGIINISQEWCAIHNPHVVEGNITVPSGVTLTIEAGVEVRFNSGTQLEVSSGGTLVATGTLTQSIMFTANSASPAPGSWRSFRFLSGSQGSLAYCDLGYAGQANLPALHVDSSNVQLSRCSIHDSLVDAIQLPGAGLAPTLADLTIADNGGRAVYQNTVDMTPAYSNLSVSGNGTDAIVSAGGNFNRNATLSAAGTTPSGVLPYIWLGPVDVSNGFTLTINPGVELRFPSGFDLEIQPNATLLAEGTPTEPITFTASSTSPTPGSWRYFYFHSGSHASLSRCDLGFAGQLNYPALYVDSSDVRLSLCAIHDNLADAIELRGAGLRPTLEELIVVDNGGRAVYQNTMDMIPAYSNLSVSGNGTDAIVSAGGNFNRNATLVVPGTTAEGRLPYIWLSPVDVSSNYTLTIDPGVELRFASGFDLEIQPNATLLAEGTPSQPITFTANLTSPTPGSWRYFYFHSGSHGSLSRCDLGFAGQLNYPALYVDSSDVVLSHCSIHDNSGDAMQLRGVGLAPTLAELAIADNGGRAVYQNTVDMTPAYSNLSVSGNGTNAIVSAGGNFNRNATLSVVGSTSGGVLPYIWLGPVDVSSNYTLTINPGVELRFPSGFDLEIQPNATLLAEGTPTQPITFTANSTSPAPGSWRYFYFHSGSHASLSYCDLGFAGQLNYPALYVDSSEVRVESCRLHHNLDEALEVRSNAQPLVRYSAIEDNGFGLRNDTPATLVDARENWWGDASGPYHATLNPGGLGDAISNGVLFEPWLGPHAYFWREPQAYLLHGLETLGWFEFAADQPAAQSVDILATIDGQPYTLGSSLPQVGELIWDTTVYPNGLYELRAVFRDGGGQVVAEVVKTVAVNNSAAIAWHGGRLAASETWEAGKVQVVEEDLYVPGGITLTVQAGTIVKFASHVGITVEDGGTLDTPATEANPIVFTSLADDSAGGDTNMDGDHTLPLPGDWRGVTVQGTGVFLWNPNVQLRYVQVTHSGTLTANETWYGNALHQVIGNVTIPSGVTLTIQPGAVVKFDTPTGSKLGIVVNAGGSLLAQGSVAQPIVFTSFRDDAYGGDSNGDGNATSPAAGDWRWLYVAGQATLDHVIVAYGAGTSSGNWDQTGALRTSGSASLEVANSLIRDAFFDGILAWGGPVAVTNSVVVGADRGICAHPGSTVNVVNSTLDGNRIGLLLHGGTFTIANTLATHNLAHGFLWDYGPANWSIRYSGFWNPGATNYGGIPDQTGVNGNIAANPGYKDREGGNYRLDYQSPAIDAADGILAPESDTMGAPRYDDPRTPNTGTPTPGGAYADMGAYEFVETAASNIDLVVKEVQGPLSTTSGEVVAVAWTVVNNGVEAAVGPWHDRVELVHSPEATPAVLLAGEVLVGQDVTLGPGQQFRASAMLRVPGGVEADYYWQVETNSRGDLFEGQNRANNVTHSQSTVALAVPELVLDGAPLARRFTAVGEPDWFKVTQPRDVDVELFLQSDDGRNVVDLYAGRGYIPSWQTYDYRQTEDNTANPSTFLPAGADAAMQPLATYYLLADPRKLSGSGHYTIGARRLGFELTSVRPTEVGNVGDVTLELRGGQLEPNTDFFLIGPDASVITTPVVYSFDGTLVEVTFDVSGRPLGWYDVQVTGPAGTITLPDAVNVLDGVPPRVWVTAIGPRHERVGATFNYQVLYGNSGNVDAPVTLLDFYVPQGFTLLGYGDSSTFPTLVETHAAHDVTWSAARLGPGAGERLNVCLQCTNTGPQVTFYSPATAVPYNRSALSSRADPSTTVSDEIVTANTEYLYAVTHLVGDDGAADISYEMQITDTEAPITPTLIYTDDGLYEIVYLEVTMPAAGVDAAGIEATGGTAAESKQVKFKFKVPKVDPGVVYEWYERGKAWLGIGTTTLQKKAERDFRKDLARCLEELGYIKDHQRNALDGLADGQWLGRIGIQAAKEVIGRTPLAIYYEPQLNVVQELLDKDPWFARLQLIGQGQAGNTDKWMRKDNQSFINMTPLYGGNNDPSAFFKNVISNDDVQRCLQRLCETKGKPPAPRCADANESENEVCKLQTNEAEAKTSCVASYDPNDKSGPQGAGPERFIAPWQGLGYGIAFENVITATAPAQTVVITDHLDGSKVDLSTFQLGAITFGGTQVTPPPGRTEFATLVDLRPARDLLVQIDAELDPGAGLVTWRFTSLDPLTRALPEDPLAGFLPPNAAPPEGEGYVFYTLQQRPGLGSGAEIRNQATIVFDQNEPILTPEWWNTIDADPPTSSVDPLPATSPSAFSVSWAGSDTGSGVAYYDLYVSEDGGSFVPWQTHITRTHTIFTGQGGHSYSFYTVATDTVGHREAAPVVPDAETWSMHTVYLPLVVRKQ